MNVTTRLMCQVCGRQSQHEVHYAGGTLHEIRCLTCSNMVYVHHRPVGPFLQEFKGRIVSKPARFWKELAASPSLPWALPRRLASKPIRVAREMIEILH